MSTALDALWMQKKRNYLISDNTCEYYTITLDAYTHTYTYIHLKVFHSNDE